MNMDLDQLTHVIESRSRRSRTQNDRPAQLPYEPVSPNETEFQFYPLSIDDLTGPISSNALRSSLTSNYNPPEGKRVHSNVTAQPPIVADFLPQQRQDIPPAFPVTGANVKSGSSSQHAIDSSNQHPSVFNFHAMERNNAGNIQIRDGSEQHQGVINATNFGLNSGLGSTHQMGQNGIFDPNSDQLQARNFDPNRRTPRISENSETNTSRYNSNNQKLFASRPPVTTSIPQQQVTEEVNHLTQRQHKPNFGHNLQLQSRQFDHVSSYEQNTQETAGPSLRMINPQYPLSSGPNNPVRSSRGSHMPSTSSQQAQIETIAPVSNALQRQPVPRFSGNPALQSRQSDHLSSYEKNSQQTAGPDERTIVTQKRLLTYTHAPFPAPDTRQITSFGTNPQTRAIRFNPCSQHRQTEVPVPNWQQPHASSSSQTQFAHFDQAPPADQSGESRCIPQEAQSPNPPMNLMPAMPDQAPRNPVVEQNLSLEQRQQSAQNQAAPLPPNSSTGSVNSNHKPPLAANTQQGAQILQNLFYFDQETHTMVPVFIHSQGPFGMHLPHFTGQMGSNSQSVAPMPINNPPQLSMAVVFENARKEWEHHPTSKFRLDGVDLSFFLFNPDGYKKIPQPVRSVKNSMDLWRMHKWRPATPGEKYTQAWARVPNEEKAMWSVKLRDLRTQQANQERKKWIILLLSKAWETEKRRQKVLL